MRVLVVSPVPTHPTIEGNRVCMLSYVEAIKSLGCDVDFLYAYRPWVDKPAELLETAAAWGEHFHSSAASWPDRIRQSIEYRFLVPLLRRHTYRGLCPRGLAGAIHSLSTRRNYDAIVFNYWILAPAAAQIGKTRTVLFAHDMFADRVSRTGSWWLTTDSRTETKAMDACDAVLAIQSAEAELFAKRTNSPVFTCYSYFPLTPTKPGASTDLLFLAGANAANVDAIKWFARNVMPLVWAKDSRIRLIIGGGVCHGLMKEALGEQVVLQPRVLDRRTFYAQGAMCVNPVAKGTGLKIKLFEAMAFGRVVVCDPHCLEGVYEPSQMPAISCLEPEDYVREILLRIAAPQQLQAECEAGIEYVREMNAFCRLSIAKALRL